MLVGRNGYFLKNLKEVYNCKVWLDIENNNLKLWGKPENLKIVKDIIKKRITEIKNSVNKDNLKI